MNVGTLTISLTARTAGLVSASSRVKLFERGVLASAQRINRSLGAVGMAFGALTIPIVAVTGASSKMFADFEFSLAKVIGLVGVAEDKVQEWGNSILRIAPDLAKGPKELAEALFFVTSSGIRGAETMDVLSLSAKAATAGLGETAVAADAVTSAINAYGKENLNAQQATDALIMAIREGKVVPADFATAIGKVLPISAQLGVSFKEVGAAMAAMTRTGTKASTSAIYLRRVLSTMLRPTKDAKSAMVDMGLSFSSLRSTLKQDGGLLTVLMKIRSVVDEFGQEQAAEIFPNLRALIPVLDLIGKNFKNTKKMWENMMHPVGALDDAFGAVSNTIKVKWNSAIAKIERAIVKFGATLKDFLIPIINKIAGYIDSLVNKWNSLDRGTQNSIASMSLLVAAIGPALIIFQAMLAPIFALASLFGSLAGSVVGLAAGMYVLVDIFKQIRDVQDNTKLGDFMSNVGTYLAVFLQKIKIIAFKIGHIFWNVLATVANGFNDLIAKMLNGFTALPRWLSSIFGKKYTLSKIEFAKFDVDVFLDKIEQAENDLEGLKNLRPGGINSWNWADQLFGKNGTGQFNDAFKEVSNQFKKDLKSDMKNVIDYIKKTFPDISKMLNFFKVGKEKEGFDFGVPFSTKRKLKSWWERTVPNTNHTSKSIKGISQAINLLNSSMKGVNAEFEKFGVLSDVGANRLSKLKDAIKKIKEITAGKDGYVLSDADKKKIQGIKETISKLNSIKDIQAQLEGFMSFMSGKFKDTISKALYNVNTVLAKWGSQALSILVAIAQPLADFTSELFSSIGAAIAGADNPFDSLVDMLISSIQKIGKTLLTVGILLLPFLPELGAGLMIGGAALSMLSGAWSASREKKKTGLANGGIIPPGYPNDSFDAKLSSNEAVIPLDRLPQLLGINQSGNKKVEFIIEGRVLKGILADANAVSNAY